MAGPLTIRCPYCLQGFDTDRSGSVSRYLRCPRCQREFQFRNALPAKAAGISALSAREPPEASAGILFWGLATAIGVVLLHQTRSWTPTVRGPQFLLTYFFILIGLVWASSALRNRVTDSDEFRWMGFLIFETVGIFRFLDGYALGMRHFTFLFVLMIAGGLAFFVRGDFNSHGNSSGSCGGGSGSCGGSSSGCGGGGGCGGCGG